MTSAARGRLDHRGRDRPRLVGVQLEDDLFHVVVDGHDERLEVLDDLVDILDDALNRLVLVHDAIDAERPNRGDPRSEDSRTRRTELPSV